jgi:hypothetical protein
MTNNPGSILQHVLEEEKLNIPTTIHPKQFLIKGIYFEVISFTPLNEDDASDIARQYYKNRKFKRSDKGTVVQVVTLYGLEDEIDY